jgi:hypothetical protein
MSPAWRTVALVLFALGMAAGFWSAYDREWQLSSSIRFWGFPLPHSISQLEDGQWEDYETGLAGLIVFVNFVLLAFAGPVFLGAVFGLTRLVGRLPRLERHLSFL